MDDIRAGTILRALRRRLGWTQQQLADRCGLRQQQISRIERGHASHMQVRAVRLSFAAVSARADWDIRWRGGTLDRLLDERHSTLLGAFADLLGGLDWIVAPEVTYSVFGERGSIDLVAWHPATATLLVVEVKSELTSIEATLRKHDEKTRLAPRIVEEQRGWQPVTVARLLVVPDDRTTRRRVDRAASLLGRRYPLRGWALRRWLASPSGPADGLLFLTPTPGRSRRR